MFSPPTLFGESASGIAALGLNFQAFLIQMGTFIIAFLILRKWAFKPIIKVMKERRETIEKSVKLTEDLEKQQAELESRIDKTLQESRQQADSIISKAEESARQAIREAEEKAQAKATSILEDAEKRIGTDMVRARQKLEKELVGLIAEATSVIIDEKIDTRKDAALINRALEESKSI